MQKDYLVQLAELHEEYSQAWLRIEKRSEESDFLRGMNLENRHVTSSSENAFYDIGNYIGQSVSDFVRKPILFCLQAVNFLILNQWIKAKKSVDLQVANICKVTFGSFSLRLLKDIFVSSALFCGQCSRR